MSTLTPNYGLIVPDGTDTVEQVRADYAANLNTIDGIGGGGSGGHTIVNPSGTDMPAEGKLQFTGNVSVTDDSGNGKTVVDILGGGGNVYGAFIDTNRLLVSRTTFRGSMSYTATEDCFVVFYIVPTLNDTTLIKIDGKAVSDWWRGTLITDTALIPAKKGQILSVTNANTSYDSSYFVYGVTQGTSGIFTPIIYSDTERVVGVWRDNKPLYQKTISVAPLPNSGTKEIQLDNDIEKIISMNGYAIDGNDKWDIFFNDVVPTNNNASIRVYTNTTTKKLYITTAVDLRSYTEAYITLQYTKTTDVAGSGNWNTDGVPTVHYSTSEQVIGTWIDGKPLYEKTVNFGSLPDTSEKTVSHGVADVDTIFISGGFVKAGTKFFGVEHSTAHPYEWTANVDDTNVAIETFTDRTSLTAMVTIRYTKVTD